MQAARQRLAAAEAVVDADPSTALSAAYYAMLYAARAALSKRCWLEHAQEGRIGARA